MGEGRLNKGAFVRSNIDAENIRDPDRPVWVANILQPLTMQSGKVRRLENLEVVDAVGTEYEDGTVVLACVSTLPMSARKAQAKTLGPVVEAERRRSYCTDDRCTIGRSPFIALRLLM